MTEENNISNDLKLCECGECGILIPIRDSRNRPKRFVNGHNTKGKRKHKINIITCACGCGETL